MLLAQSFLMQNIGSVSDTYIKISMGHTREEGLKNRLWACARSTYVPLFNENMEKLKADSPSAHAWLEELDPRTWVRAYFHDFPKCDTLLNNSCEVFNK